MASKMTIKSGGGEGGARYFALDVVRFCLTAMVTVFHALSELTWFLTMDEVDALLQHPFGRLIPLGYTAVDGFMVLTGFLSMSKLLRTWSNPERRPGWKDLVDSYYTRMIQIGMPLWITILWYGFFFRDGKYPEASIRSEAVLLTMRLTRNSTQAAVEGAISADGALTTLRSNAVSLWPWIALYVNNMSPFGGLLQQTWSLAVQMQWYLWLPLTPFMLYTLQRLLAVLRCRKMESTQVSFSSRAAVALCTVGLIFSAACRVIGHRHLAQFNPSSLVGFGAHFFWYASTFLRMAPLFTGALAAIFSSDDYDGLREWLIKGGTQVGALWKRNVVVSLLWANVIGVCFVNAFWKDITHMDDEASPALHHELMYVLCRPGGTLSAIGYAWLVYCACHGIGLVPLWTVQKSKLESDPAEDPASPVSVEPKTPSSLRARRSVSTKSSSQEAVTAAPNLPAKPAAKATPVAFWRRVVSYFVPITFMVYLINSTLYEQLYGWPQRLHPCPGFLHPRASEISERYLSSPSYVFQAGSQFESLNEPIHSAELYLSSTFTATIQFLRGPKSLYCSGEAADAQCSGLCFSNEMPNIDMMEDASCMLFHNCTLPKSPSSTLRVPATAWMQFWHYSLICVVLTWGLAWLFFVTLEVPIGLILMHPFVKRLMIVPVLLHAVVCLMVSIPAHLYMNYVILSNLTPAVEQHVMHAHFK